MTRAVKRAPTRVAPSPPSAVDPALDRVLWRMRLRLQQRLYWLTTGMAVPEGTRDELHAVLTGRNDPDAERAWRSQDRSASELNTRIAEIEAEIERDDSSRLARLCTVFGLSPVETDALHATLALALEPSLGRVYTAITGSPNGEVPESALGRLFDHAHRAVPGADGPLRLWDLVRRHDTHGGASLELDPLVRSWLVGGGRDELDVALVGCARPAVVYEPPASWPVDATADQVAAALARDGAARVRVQVLGVPRSGRRTFAAVVAARVRFRALIVESDAVDSSTWPHVFQRAQRQAFLGGTALIFAGETMRGRWPTVPDMFALQFAVSDSRGELPSNPRLIDLHVALPLPSWKERRALWRGHVAGAGRWNAAGLDALARTHRVGPGDIAAVARRDPSTPAEAGRMIRRAARQDMSDLAQRLPTTFRRDDLVVDDATRTVLDDIVFEAANRAAFWERPAARRLFPQGRGLAVLFSGVPGTGKTMAAQVIARELRRDLFRIDLPSVVSKYVGETSQRLASILARTTDSILLFDEADALFGKRTEVHDAHDRYAAADTGALLTAIESYPGMAFLCTNRRASIDPAYLRRMRYSLEFPKPTAEQRRALWERLVGELVSVEAGEALAPALAAIAQSVDSTGAQIKASVLGAIFMAARAHTPIGVAHILRALDREMVKEGRVLSDRERRKLQERAR